MSYQQLICQNVNNIELFRKAQSIWQNVWCNQKRHARLLFAKHISAAILARLVFPVVFELRFTGPFSVIPCGIKVP
jgi:hypothetical protein